MRVNLGCPDKCADFDVCIDRLTSPGVSVYDLGASIPPGSVDYVYSKNLLEHLGNPLQFLVSVFAVLKPGGVLDLITDNARFAPFYWKRFAFFNRWFKYGVFGVHAGVPFQRDAGDHYCIFSEAHLRRLFGAAGFRVDRVEFGVFQGRIAGLGTTLAPRIRVTGVRW